MNRVFLLLLCLCIFGGCEMLSVDKIGFCYSDENGRQYCGDIGFAPGKSDDAKSVVIEETTPDGDTRDLFTFTDEEVRIIASQLGNANPPEGLSTSSAEEGAPPEYMKPGLSDIRRVKIYCEQMKGGE